MYIPSCISLPAYTCQVRKRIQKAEHVPGEKRRQKSNRLVKTTVKREKNGKEDNDSKDRMGCTKNDVHTTYPTM